MFEDLPIPREAVADRVVEQPVVRGLATTYADAEVRVLDRVDGVADAAGVDGVDPGDAERRADVILATIRASVAGELHSLFLDVLGWAEPDRAVEFAGEDWADVVGTLGERYRAAADRDADDLDDESLAVAHVRRVHGTTPAAYRRWVCRWPDNESRARRRLLVGGLDRAVEGLDRVETALREGDAAEAEAEGETGDDGDPGGDADGGGEADAGLDADAGPGPDPADDAGGDPGPDPG